MLTQITIEIPSVQKKLDDYKKQKALQKSAKASLVSAQHKHQFLVDILTINGTELVPPLIKFFKNIGYPRTKDADVGKAIKKVNKAEDIIVLDGDKLIAIEVTSNRQNGAISDDKCSCITRYIANIKSEYPNFEAHGLLVLNSWSDEHRWDKRVKAKNPFTTDQIKTANNMGYGLTTTTNLVKAYLELKKGSINKEQFRNYLYSSGHIDFKNMGGGLKG